MPLPHMGTVSISDHIFLIHILWACAISNQNREKTNLERAFSSHSPPKPISNVYKFLPYRNWVVKPANLINKLTKKIPVKLLTCVMCSTLQFYERKFL